jgi:hypothetical protein
VGEWVGGGGGWEGLCKEVFRAISCVNVFWRLCFHHQGWKSLKRFT